MNKNYGITAENLLKTFPQVLKENKSMLALATVIAEELAQRPSEIDRLMIYTRIDTLPEELLDILAYDFKVDWWDYDYTLEEKRRTLKDSWNVHRTLGTKGAGITPAYAGRICCCCKCCLLPWDHPRIRGENILAVNLQSAVQGSPPHTRGEFTR